ncbi:FUSC family protein [Herbiconiux sp. SYSU D00978]|uniref:FUSC family protein n=1 Tax=Herbiconiux sp. SYSU D00978 TaxID=2812562 RepID=UPI001A974ADD|nr:FUSC family protein [Herbiconiux sp. SYSU D00978]
MTSGHAGRDQAGSGDWLRGLVVLGPHAGAHRVAIRAGISVLVPLLVLLAIGRLEWSLYASFGAFTSLYGRNASYVPRLRMQLTVGALLVASVLLGVLVALVPERAWLVVTLGAVWAVLMSVASDVGRWAPPGPMFLVFAFGAVASAPATPDSVPTAFVVATASAVFSVLVGVGGALVAGRPRRLLERTPGERASLRAALRDRALVVRAVRFGVAAFLAGALATAVGIGHPYWAMLSAVVPLVAADLSHAVLRASHRVVGTLVGVALALPLLLLHPTGLVAILLVVALQVTAELLVLRNYGLALVFITPLALVMIELATDSDPLALARDRAVETVLGCLLALLVAALFALPGRRRAAGS